MTPLLRIATAASKMLERAALIVSSSGLALMATCILIQIVARYIFAEPPAWTEELARHAMIWSGFAGATVAFSRRADPVLFQNASLPQGWMRRTAQYIEITAVSIFCIAILACTPDFMALHRDLSTETLELPSQLIVAIIPLSMLTILFHAAVRLIALICGEKADEKGVT